jgi:outer membrane cobalamin receptor
MLSRIALVLVLAVAIPACAARGAVDKPGFTKGKLITADDIARIGANTAWDVLRRSGTHISTSQTARGEPTRISRRGTSSISFVDRPLVYVDGAQLVEFGYLRQLPARSISSMRILSGIEATPLYGTNAGSGVIEILTRTGSD